MKYGSPVPQPPRGWIPATATPGERMVPKPKTKRARKYTPGARPSWNPSLGSWYGLGWLNWPRKASAAVFPSDPRPLTFQTVDIPNGEESRGGVIGGERRAQGILSLPRKRMPRPRSQRRHGPCPSSARDVRFCCRDMRWRSRGIHVVDRRGRRRVVQGACPAVRSSVTGASVPKSPQKEPFR